MDAPLAQAPQQNTQPPPETQPFFPGCSSRVPLFINMPSDHQMKAPTEPTMEVQSASNLKLKYGLLINYICQKPINKRKFKATNIPKFLLKVFSSNIPFKLEQSHKTRLKLFLKGLSQSKTRFDLVELFGPSEDEQKNQQNKINREVLKRLLARNYQNILRNKHIRNKRLYLLFCKKIILRLDHPTIIDRLEV